MKQLIQGDTKAVMISNVTSEGYGLHNVQMELDNVQSVSDSVTKSPPAKRPCLSRQAKRLAGKVRLSLPGIVITNSSRLDNPYLSVSYCIENSVTHVGKRFGPEAD